MRFINPNFYLSLIFCLILFISGRQLAELPSSGKTKGNITAILSLIALPSLLFPLGYLNFFGESPLYCSFRAINRSEILTSLIAPLFGYITYLRPRSVIREYGFSAMTKRLRPFAFPFCLLFITFCFVKPIIRPLDKNIDFLEIWENDVMMQSSASTCGPSSLATVMYSIDSYRDSEEDIARGAYTCRTGADNWYLARYSIALGYKAKFSVCRDITEVPVPSIAGVRINGAGHFIAILSVENNIVEIGDPLRGKLYLSPSDFNNLYEFSGFLTAFS